jgi:hypothetical protein
MEEPSSFYIKINERCIRLTVFLRLAIVFLDFISIVLTSLEFKTFKKY